MSKITAIYKIDNITEKMKIVIDFIIGNDYESKLLTKTVKSIFTLDEFVYASCLKDHFNYSYKKYEHAIKIGKLHLPSRSQLNRFIIKVAKYKIYDQIHKKYISLHLELITNINSIDSTFIPNENVNKKSDYIGINPHYHNKFGSKITVIANQMGFPLLVNIDSGNVNDSKIGTTFIQSINAIDKSLIGNLMLADSGYDSNNFKNELTAKQIKYIIPKNKRNFIEEDVKEIINDEIKTINNQAKIKRVNVWNTIKTIRKSIIKTNTETEKEDKLNKIKQLKEELKQLKKEQIEKIKKSKIFIKEKAKKDNRKNKKFNIGLTNEEKVIYKKRSYNEHIYTFFKAHRLDKVSYKTKEMFYHQIYSTIIDKIMFIERQNK